jgi:RNA polymerase sigma-70 factor (ECF subfamily)
MAVMSDESFAAVYDRYYDRLCGFIRARVRDAWQAEDLTQETFLQARRRIDSLRDMACIKPWLFRIAYNICQDHFRAKQNQLASDRPMDDAEGVIHPHRPEKWFEQQQMGACLQKQILLLPASYRTVLWLYDVLGFTHKEIAEVLAIEEGTMKVRLHRARRKMKTILESNCRFERDERNIFVCVPN